MDSKYSVTKNWSPKKHHFNRQNGFSMKKKYPHINDYDSTPSKIPKLLESKKQQQNYNNNNKNNAYSSNKNNNNNSQRNNASLALSSDKIKQHKISLPIYESKVDIMQTIKKTDTVVFMGETGSGKTTQLPQYLLEDGYGRSGMIGITQPRRVAAITIAKRVAQEQNCQLGALVGYTVRFEDCTSKDTKIRYMTDGSLLREALTDRLLKNYSVLMLDEVHERTINSDVLLGIAKEAQKRRRAEGMTPLKLIITSATMDIDNFCAYFKVPGMYLEGREHPVRVFHVKQKQSDYMLATLSTLFQVHRDLPLDHDILVFLTGQEEIESMSQTLRHFAKDNTEDMRPVRVFPLYAQLPQPKQMECFMPAPANARKIILATNIAETSITIPGIRCVIDCGYVKRRIYNADTALDVLRVTRISQAQAWQRSGRAGRDSAGCCYRMYTMQQMEEMDEMPQPELLRSNLSSTVLQLLALGIDCKNFDFLDKPDGAAIDNAYTMLTTLGAVKKLDSGKHELTAVGRRMVQFPLEPQYSKLLLVAPQFGCLEEMIKLVAMLSSENVFITPQEKRELASLAHSKFQHESGDHLTLLNVFNAYLKTDKIKTWCHDNFINIRNITYASEVRLQLIEIARRLNLQMKSCDEDIDKVKKCLLAGLFDNIAKLQRDNTYLTISGRQTARLHPSSIFHGKYRPKYIIYTDIMHTQRIFLRQVTEIQRDWISEVVPNYPYLNRIF